MRLRLTRGEGHRIVPGMRGLVAFILCLVLGLGALAPLAVAEAPQMDHAHMAMDHEAGDAPCPDGQCDGHDHALGCMSGVHCIAIPQVFRPSLTAPTMGIGKRPTLPHMAGAGLDPETEVPPPKA